MIRIRRKIRTRNSKQNLVDTIIIKVDVTMVKNAYSFTMKILHSPTFLETMKKRKKMVTPLLKTQDLKAIKLS
jgi:hypothetical protein